MTIKWKSCGIDDSDDNDDNHNSDDNDRDDNDDNHNSDNNDSDDNDDNPVVLVWREADMGLVTYKPHNYYDHLWVE